MHDRLADNRSIRTFNILDDYNREGLGIEVDLSLPSARVIRTLDRIIEWRGKPQTIRSDNGPEYISGEFQNWAKKRGIHLQYIQPGKPQQNAYIERFNRTVRHEWLDEPLCSSRLNMLSTRRLNGFGATMLNDRTWHWVASPRIRSWRKPRDLYF
jgi:putative transposase